MFIRPQRITLAVGVLALSALACLVIDRVFAPNQTTLPDAGSLERGTRECDATEHISFYGMRTSYEVNEEGTFCKYLLTISNKEMAQPVIVLVKRHYVDGYAGADESEWLLVGEIAGLANTTLDGYVNVYNDPDAKGPGAVVHERVSAVWPWEDCTAAKFDEELIEHYSVDIREDWCPLKGP